MTEPQSDLAIAIGENEAAAHQVLDAVLRILSWIEAGPLDDKASEIRKECTSIMEACTWQDIVGQRLTKVASFLSATGPMQSGFGSSDPLLNGPALPGAGLTQQDVEEILKAR